MTKAIEEISKKLQKIHKFNLLSEARPPKIDPLSKASLYLKGTWNSCTGIFDSRAVIWSKYLKKNNNKKIILWWLTIGQLTAYKSDSLIHSWYLRINCFQGRIVLLKHLKNSMISLLVQTIYFFNILRTVALFDIWACDQVLKRLNQINFVGLLQRNCQQLHCFLISDFCWKNIENLFKSSFLFYDEINLRMSKCSASKVPR